MVSFLPGVPLTTQSSSMLTRSSPPPVLCGQVALEFGLIAEADMRADRYE